MQETLERERSPQLDNPLFGRVNHLQEHWREEGLPSNWQELPATGFQMSLQMELLPDLFTEEDFNKWIGQTREDMTGFILEYLAQGLVFPIWYELAEVDGEKRIIMPLYGEKLMVDTVSEQERNGKVKTSLKELENYFVDAPDASIAVMTSPAGWSGLKAPGTNTDIIFSDSQTYIFQKNGEEINGFSIRTDFSLAEHRKLISTLIGVELPATASVCDYVTALVCMNGDQESSVVDIAGVVDLMKDIRGSDFANGERKWEEIYQDLGRREALWTFEARTKAIFEQFVDFAESQLRNNSHDKNLIQQALAVTVLDIAKSIRGKPEKPRRTDDVVRGTIVFNLHRDPLSPPVSYIVGYGNILKDVQQLPGCAGGGGTSKEILVNALVPRLGILDSMTSGHDEYGSLQFQCSKCGKTNTRPNGQLIQNCQHCSMDVRC